MGRIRRYADACVFPCVVSVNALPYSRPFASVATFVANGRGACVHVYVCVCVCVFAYLRPLVLHDSPFSLPAPPRQASQKQSSFALLCSPFLIKYRVGSGVYLSRFNPSLPSLTLTSPPISPWSVMMQHRVLFLYSAFFSMPVKRPVSPLVCLTRLLHRPHPTASPGPLSWGRTTRALSHSSLAGTSRRRLDATTVHTRNHTQANGKRQRKNTTTDVTHLSPYTVGIRHRNGVARRWNRGARMWRCFLPATGNTVVDFLLRLPSRHHSSPHTCAAVPGIRRLCMKA